MNVLDSVRKTICEYCGAYVERGNHIHHIHQRGSGGTDVPDNLICLCFECHTKVHAGNIPRWDLINIVARRGNKTPEEVCEAIGLLLDKIKPQDYTFSIPDNPLQGKSLEEVLQAYCSYSEVEETAIWEKAAILTAMVDAGLRIKTISSLIGCSPASIRERVRTYRAFPDPSMRAIDKSFTHHRIASKTTDPVKWIDMTCELDLSTRQLQEAIEAEGQDEMIKKDINLEKAERIIRMTKEILALDTDISAFLKNELYAVLGENENDRIDRTRCTDEVA